MTFTYNFTPSDTKAYIRENWRRMTDARMAADMGMTEGQVKRIRQEMKLFKKDTGQRSDTLCWRCRNAKGNGCRWFRFHMPIKGWKAALRCVDGNESYRVRECPEFVG